MVYSPSIPFNTRSSRTQQIREVLFAERRFIFFLFQVSKLADMHSIQQTNNNNLKSIFLVNQLTTFMTRALISILHPFFFSTCLFSNDQFFIHFQFVGKHQNPSSLVLPPTLRSTRQTILNAHIKCASRPPIKPSKSTKS